MPDKTEQEPFRIQAFKLKDDWKDYKKGEILLAVHDDDNHHTTGCSSKTRTGSNRANK